jgi:hypothetical protein
MLIHGQEETGYISYKTENIKIDKSRFETLWEKSKELCVQFGEVHKQLEALLT